ncbi:MAG: peptidoglycan DD-metalloendopeptidase family protein, partial [Oscillibacter sp.]|nr:peptidoglycan DD-metalloendopeptidase family protein [Oscillibacter sp.]
MMNPKHAPKSVHSSGRVSTPRRAVRWTARCAAAVLALVLLAPVFSADAVSQSQIDAQKSKAATLAKQKKALSAKIDALSGDIENNLKKKELLDGQISVMEDEISNLEDQLTTYESMIAQTEGELADARAREEAKYALFCDRVRAMEEQGQMDYWSVLFRASSFADLLTRLDFVNEIMEADQQVIDDLKSLQAEIAAKQAQLQVQRDSLAETRNEVAEKKAALDEQRETANQLIIQLKATKSEAEEDMDDLSAEEDEVQEEILRLSRQYAEEQAAKAAKAAASYNSVYNSIGFVDTRTATSGGYAWPVDSRKINSGFGGARNHKGVDIGGVGYGTAVRAAKAGTVIVSQYHYSYGNYVVVSHGSGNTTLYAHMSKRLVSVGQSVSQGSLLGLTGSTGNSTGPHLH